MVRAVQFVITEQFWTSVEKLLLLPLISGSYQVVTGVCGILAQSLTLLEAQGCAGEDRRGCTFKVFNMPLFKENCCVVVNLCWKTMVFIADVSETMLRSPVAWDLSAAQRISVVWELTALGHSGAGMQSWLGCPAWHEEGLAGWTQGAETALVPQDQQFTEENQFFLVSFSEYYFCSIK